MVAVELLEKRLGVFSYWMQQLRFHVYEWAKDSEDVRWRLMQFLARNGTTQDALIFQRMLKDAWRLTDKELDLLGNSPHLPIRFYTYELVSKIEPKRQLPSACEKEALQKELEQLRKQLQDKPKP